MAAIFLQIYGFYISQNLAITINNKSIRITFFYCVNIDELLNNAILLGNKESIIPLALLVLIWAR